MLAIVLCLLQRLRRSARPAVLLPWPQISVLLAIVSPVVSHIKNDLRAIHQYMEEQLSEENPWLVGTKIGLADFNGTTSTCNTIVHVLILPAFFGMDVAISREYGWSAELAKSQYPKFATWFERMKGRESYKRALKKGGPYDLVEFS